MPVPEPRPKVRRGFLVTLLLVAPLVLWVTLELIKVDETTGIRHWAQPPRAFLDNVGAQVAWRLPTAWVTFLQRVLPDVRPEPAGIALAALCTLAAAATLHAVARKFTRAWTWRSTIAGVLLPCVLFTLILSAGGARERVRELRDDPHPFKPRTSIDDILADIQLLDEVKESAREDTEKPRPTPAVKDPGAAPSSAR